MVSYIAYYAAPFLDSAAGNVALVAAALHTSTTATGGAARQQLGAELATGTMAYARRTDGRYARPGSYQ